MHVGLIASIYATISHEYHSLGSLTGHLEMDLVWENISAAAAVHGHATKAGSASHWRLHVLDPLQAPSYGHQIFSLKVGDTEHLAAILFR